MNTIADARCSDFDVVTAKSVRLVAETAIAAEHLPPDAALEAHWARRLAETPALFNGTVFVMAADAANGFIVGEDDVIRGRLHGVEFRTFLYWREVEWSPAVVDCFGSAILVTRDGDIILGTAGAETINSGWSYFFGGFLDPRDIGPDRLANVVESTARELQEETGLVAGVDVDAAPGFIVAKSAWQVSFGVVYRARESTDKVVERIQHHLKHENDQEIASLKIVRSPLEATDPTIQPFTAAVIRHILR